MTLFCHRGPHLAKPPGLKEKGLEAHSPAWARALQDESPPEQSLQMWRSSGNPMPYATKKVWCEEDEENTKRGRTKQWPELRDKLSGSILDLSKDHVQTSPMKEAQVPPPVFLCLGQCCTAPSDSLASDIFPPSPSCGQHSSRIWQGSAEGRVGIIDDLSLLVFPLPTVNSLISPSARQHVLSHPVERRGTVYPLPQLNEEPRSPEWQQMMCRGGHVSRAGCRLLAAEQDSICFSHKNENQ